MHPSSLLRVPDHDKRIEEREKFVADRGAKQREALEQRRMEAGVPSHPRHGFARLVESTNTFEVPEDRETLKELGYR